MAARHDAHQLITTQLYYYYYHYYYYVSNCYYYYNQSSTTVLLCCCTTQTTSDKIPSNLFSALILPVLLHEISKYYHEIIQKRETFVQIMF